MTTGNEIARRGVRPGSSGAVAAGLLAGDERGCCVTRLVDAIQSAWDRLIPVGYQDDAGFHYGAAPDSKRFN